MRQVVLFVHGMGEQEPPGAPEGFEQRIRQAFAREAQSQGKPQPSAEALAFEAVYWADVTQPDQEAFKARLGVQGMLRKFLIGSMGDVVAYSKLPYPPDKYGEIQERFADGIRRAAAAGKAQLSVIAHSLGSVIASDGIYNLQKAGTFPADLELTNVFTLASPIALFGLRYGLANFTKPIRPGVWLNFFYPQDVIGYPLKPLNDAYAQAVTEDVPLSPWGGGLWQGLVHGLIAQLPVLKAWESHGWYFSDPRVISRIGRILANQSS